MKYSLIDYRCKCNKLLFKGCLLFSAIEVKCKRCGTINIFQGEDKKKKDISFSFLVNSSGEIIDGCCATSFIKTKQNFIGREIKKLISCLRDKKEISFLRTSNNYDKINDDDSPNNNYYLFGRIDSNKIDFN